VNGEAGRHALPVTRLHVDDADQAQRSSERRVPPISARSPRSTLATWARRVLLTIGVVVPLMAALIGVEWVITPSVADAQQRVHAFAVSLTRPISMSPYPQSMPPLWSRPRTAGSTAILGSTFPESPAARWGCSARVAGKAAAPWTSNSPACCMAAAGRSGTTSPRRPFSASNSTLPTPRRRSCRCTPRSSISGKVSTACTMPPAVTSTHHPEI